MYIVDYQLINTFKTQISKLDQLLFIGKVERNLLIIFKVDSMQKASKQINKSLGSYHTSKKKRKVKRSIKTISEA